MFLNNREHTEMIKKTSIFQRGKDITTVLSLIFFEQGRTLLPNPLAIIEFELCLVNVNFVTQECTRKVYKEFTEHSWFNVPSRLNQQAWLC